MVNKAVLFIIDGLGDLPTPKTALQAAKKKNFDWLAKSGSTGMMSTISNGITPGSDVSHLQLLGYDPATYYPGRGPLEALGVGIDLQEGDVAFRANFATVAEDGRKIIDRRAGRIATAAAKQFEKYANMQLDDIQVMFKSSVEHRGALVLRGQDLSHYVTDTDPHGHGDEILQSSVSAPGISSKEKVYALRTAEAVNEFTQKIFAALGNAEENKTREAAKKPKANMVLLRSAGVFKKIPSLAERFGITGACIAGGALYKGIARYVGMDIIEVAGATGTAATNLKAKGEAVVKALQKYDLVFLHVKACDSFGHDGDFDGKKKMLERIDGELLPQLIKSKAKIIVTGDHSTPCVRKAHSGHEVPILIYGENERKDKVAKFDEFACMQGGLGHLRGSDVMPIILNMIEKGKMYGS